MLAALADLASAAARHAARALAPLALPYVVAGEKTPRFIYISA